jgi:S-adenosylmethionine hydrolase
MGVPTVALLSDFGTRDWYVAALRGVILSRCPRATLLDITHDIPPQDILAGAFTLAAAVPWLPPWSVVLAVVDPGVGSTRSLLAARADGRYFVGPDNGLLALALQHAARRTVIRLTNRRYWLTNVSRTFQGRDVMAPVAAYLAAGGSLGRLGVPLRFVKSLGVPSPSVTSRSVRGRVIHVDRFGNVITNVPGSLIRKPRVHLRYRQRAVRLVGTYAEGRPREVVGLVNSQGLLELAVREGSAAVRCAAIRGDPVELRW